MTTSILIKQSNEIESRIEILSQKVAKLQSKRPTRRRIRKINQLEIQIFELKKDYNLIGFKITHKHLNPIAFISLEITTKERRN